MAFEVLKLKGRFLKTFMEFKEVIQKRYSCRSYKDEPVPEEKILSLLEAARLAPSAHNRQPYRFIVVKDKEKIKKLAEAANQSFIAEAPVVIVGVALDPEDVLPCEVPTYAVDVAIAMEHIALQATDEGLGSCWIGAFSQEKVKEILQIPEDQKVVALMPIGWPNDFPSVKERKNLEDLVSYQ